MKILLICKRYYTNKDLLSDRFGRLFYLPVELAKHGHEVCVAAADYRNRHAHSETLENVAFHMLPFPTRFLWRTLALARHMRPDLIIASADSLYGGIGLALARWLGVPLVFDVYDQYLAFGSNRIPGMKTLYFKTLRAAALVTCASMPMVEFCRAYNANVLLITNSIDPRRFHPKPKAEARRALAIPAHDTVVGYFGSMEKNRSVDTLIAACAQLVSSNASVPGHASVPGNASVPGHPRLRLLLAGRVDTAAGLDLSAPWIDYRGMVAQECVADMINAADAVVIPYLQDTLIDMGCSCKTAEYLACGAPVVSTKVDNFLATYPQASAAIALCAPRNPTDMARAISEQLRNPRVAEFPPDLTWAAQGEKLAHALERIKKMA